MLIETGKLAKRIVAQDVLKSDMSDDLKLFEVFKIYKEDLKEEYSQLYYALLGWKDAHLKELLAKPIELVQPIENNLADMYGVDTMEFEDPKEFTQHYCHNCGSQRCEGVGTEWFEGCGYKEHLKDYEKFYG